MFNVIKIIEDINKYSIQMGGVFDKNDLLLCLNLSTANDDKFKRIIKILLKEKILFRFCRGFYITKNYNIEILSSKIDSTSYISCETILAKKCIIGPTRNNYITAISTKPRKREYSNDIGTIKYLSIKKELSLFGVETAGNYKVANPEKAFIDTLYFYNKGCKFNFNIYEDINIELLNKKLILEYLKNYKNSKFKTFVKGILK